MCFFRIYTAKRSFRLGKGFDAAVQDAFLLADQGSDAEVFSPARALLQREPGRNQ